MPRGRSFAPRGRSGGVHNKEWTTFFIDGTALDLAIGSIVAFSALVADEAETLLRSRGLVKLVLDASSINESATVAMGLAMVSARAVAAGAASLPRPASEGSFPWLWHDWGIVSSFAGAGTGGIAEVSTVIVDSKAMRKVKEDEVLALVFEIAESTDGGGVVRIDAGFRILSGD